MITERKGFEKREILKSEREKDTEGGREKDRERENEREGERSV